MHHVPIKCPKVICDVPNLFPKSNILIRLVCLGHDNSAAKAFYGRIGLCIFYGRTGLCIFYRRTGLGIILALRVMVVERHTPAIDRVVTTVY